MSSDRPAVAESSAGLREVGSPLDLLAAQLVARPPKLLVCSDPLVLKSGAKILEEAGFEIHRADGWSEALRDFESLRPAAILVDGAFLEGSGPELCAALRRQSGRIEVPVLVLCKNSRDRERALRSGANEVAEKPVDWSVVSRRLLALSRGFRASEEMERSRRIVAEARRLVAEAWEKSHHQGSTDALTGLPNRARLDAVVERALARGRTMGIKVVLLFLDIDRFSDINETLGRPGGDEVLRSVARVLLDCLRSDGWPKGIGLAARISGDEFALMLGTDITDEQLSKLAESVLTAISQRLNINGTDCYISVSIGIAVASSHQMEAEALLQQAETAMYSARCGGGGCYRFYSEAFAGAMHSRLGMDRRLRSAFERRELALHYQPVLEAGTRRLVGVEALLRWYDPKAGMVSPADFVPVAEDTGLMTPIGTWVLETACGQIKGWMEEGLPAMRVAVNVSRCQLERGDLAGEVERVLGETGLPPALLELELSERGVLRSDPAVLAQLKKIKRLGARLVVDDFGTGQTGMSYLTQFNLDGLKIDRSFVKGILYNSQDDAITAAIVAMAQRLKMDVTAEGVETEAQRDRICEYGCQAIQGFLYSVALPADELRARLDSSHGWLELGSPGGRDEAELTASSAS
jgi:diguanylate cyclase (GGDEF)-like protein